MQTHVARQSPTYTKLLLKCDACAFSAQKYTKAEHTIIQVTYCLPTPYLVYMYIKPKQQLCPSQERDWCKQS